MAYHTSPATSDSPSPTSSTQVSPHIRTTPLDSMLDDDSPTSGEGTPHRSAINLPRTQTSGKGGCWTCRVRRKKCDEVREDGSCKTCKRLTIQCLGWGAKRPEWMRDKKNVDAYKASIKAQLSRAGLIRGQPRPQPLPVPQRIVSSTRPSKPTSAEVIPQPLESPQPPPRIVPSSTPAEPQPPSPFDALSAAAYDPFDPSASFHYQAALSNGAPYGTSLIPDLLADPSYSLFAGTDLAFLDPSPIVPNHPNPSELDHYLNHVPQFQFAFASDLLADVTYTAAMNDHQGAVTLAICALAQLHSKQERISQGLELPNLVPDSSSGNYLVTEALMKLDNNHSINRSWQDSDALAALYLVRLSQISGGGCDWEVPFNIMCQWLTQHNLHTSENTWHAFLNISATSQLLAKYTLWLDVFVSLSRQRPPKFFILLQRLLAEQQNFWANGSEQHGPHRLRMDLLTGCPDEVLLAIAEVSNLAHWKASQIRNGCLSYPELIRQGTAIEHRLRRAPSDLSRHDRQTSTAGPTREQRAQVANIFKETARLYLHTVMSNSAPGVPEIKASVDTIMRLFSQLPPGPVDRALVFPICFAGCMTNDSNRREFMKNRIMSLDEGFGNSMQTRRLMEAVWQQRDVGNKEVDIREVIQEQGLSTLLLI